MNESDLEKISRGSSSRREKNKKERTERNKGERREERERRKVSFYICSSKQTKKTKNYIKVKQSIRWIACIGLHDR